MDYRRKTVLTHSGNRPEQNHGIINPPVYHASTILFPSVAEMDEAYRKPVERQDGDLYRYGLTGTPTTEALEHAVAELEGGYNAVATGSGLMAVTLSLMAFLKTGDHLLMVDSVYSPTRRFCANALDRFGVETTYYDPLIGADIEDLVRDNTRVVFLESPGSLTFEVQDVPAITAVARSRGIVTVLDNTWATPLFFRPFDHGVDISVHAATKYMVGHGDVLSGMIVCGSRDHYLAVKRYSSWLGNGIAPDDAYLTLRGLRSMAPRLAMHQDHAMIVARWLQQRPEVDRVLYPALPEDAGHDLWRRDFLGASGLMGIVLARPYTPSAVAAMLDDLALIPMGASWGGYMSLILPTDPARYRTATSWNAPGPSLRLHVGLEDPQDLIDDLAKGFDRLNRAD